MASLTRKIKSPHIQLGFAVGMSILALATASRWLLPEPMGYLSQAFPPFLAVVYEVVYNKRPNSRLSAAWYWVVAILLATALVIGIHMLLAAAGRE